MEYDNAIEFVKKAVKLLVDNQKFPLRIVDWRGGGGGASAYGGLGVQFQDTICVDNLNQQYGSDWPKDVKFAADFEVKFMGDVFNAEHLVIDDKLEINDIPHEAKVICRCGYIIHGEWIRWRKKEGWTLPLKLN